MKWIKGISKTSFDLIEKDKTTLQMTFNYDQKGNPVICKGSGFNFSIIREGFWKSNLLIKENEQLIGRTYTEKWFSNYSILEIKGQQIKYKYRNNSMAELAFFVENEANVMLTCGLKSDNDKKVVVELNISQGFEQNPLKYYILSICWYIFCPIAQENTIDYLLLMAQ